MSTLPVAVTVTSSDGQSASASASITVTSSGTTINVGETTILTTVDNGNGNLLAAQPITLAQPASLQSLSFYVNPVGGQLRLGLYSGTTPIALVAQTAAFTPVLGWNTQPATSVQLPSGQYWLAYLPQSNTLGFRKADTGGTSYFKTFTFAALPATFPASPSTTTSHWSFYGTFNVAPPPPDTTPPSVPTNLIATSSASLSTTVDLAWTASTDNVGVTGYDIYRDGSKIATTPVNSYTDTGVTTPSTSHSYAVDAFDAAGNVSMITQPIFVGIGSPVVIGIGLSNVSVGNPPNANTLVGAVSVTVTGGQPFHGIVMLGGTDGPKFALTNGGALPCNLVVGPVDIAAGSYSINLTAN